MMSRRLARAPLGASRRAPSLLPLPTRLPPVLHSPPRTARPDAAAPPPRLPLSPLSHFLVVVVSHPLFSAASRLAPLLPPFSPFPALRFFLAPPLPRSSPLPFSPRSVRTRAGRPPPPRPSAPPRGARALARGRRGAAARNGRSAPADARQAHLIAAPLVAGTGRAAPRSDRPVEGSWADGPVGLVALCGPPRRGNRAGPTAHAKSAGGVPREQQARQKAKHACLHCRDRAGRGRASRLPPRWAFATAPSCGPLLDRGGVPEQDPGLCPRHERHRRGAFLDGDRSRAPTFTTDGAWAARGDAAARIRRFRSSGGLAPAHGRAGEGRGGTERWGARGAGV